MTEFSANGQQPTSETAAPGTPGASPVSAAATETSKPNADSEYLERWARFTREEQRLRQQKTEIESKAQRLKDLEDLERLKDDPDALLARFGWDYHKLTERHLSGASAQPKDEKVTDLERQVQELQAQLRDRFGKEDQEKEAAALAGVLGEIRGLVDTDERFELVKLNDAHNDVWELMCAYYKEHKKWLSPEQAAQEIETELENQAKKLMQARKLQSAPPAQPTSQEAPAATSQTAQDLIARTLSNRMAPSPGAGQTEAKPSSAEELRNMALNAYREISQRGR